MTNQFTPQYPCVEAKASTFNFSRERYFMAYELPPLPYDYSALEPYVDTQTMQLHHDKHHAAYVTNVNAALQNNSEFASLSIDDLVRRLNDVPENIRTAVRNNGGGHVNHSMFWKIMTPNGGGEPTGELASAIQQAFGSFASLKTPFTLAVVNPFGSGWLWLVLYRYCKFQFIFTAIMVSSVIECLYPVLG